jgi:hypothetical protein
MPEEDHPYDPKIYIDIATSAGDVREVDGTGEQRATDGEAQVLRIVDEV